VFFSYCYNYKFDNDNHLVNCYFNSLEAYITCVLTVQYRKTNCFLFWWYE